MWRPGRSKSKAAEKDVITEATSLLCGRASERRGNARRAVPAWVPLNTLAHADIQRLQEVAARRNVNSGGWAATVGYLAVEILAETADEADLLRIQREQLIPLELWLLGDIGAPTTPGQLARLVTGTLDPRYEHREH